MGLWKWRGVRQDKQNLQKPLVQINTDVNSRVLEFSKQLHHNTQKKKAILILNHKACLLFQKLFSIVKLQF